MELNSDGLEHGRPKKGNLDKNKFHKIRSFSVSTMDITKFDENKLTTTFNINENKDTVREIW